MSHKTANSIIAHILIEYDHSLIIQSLHLLGDELLLEASDLRTNALTLLEEVEGGEVLNTVVSGELLQALVGGIDGGEGHVLARTSELVVEGSDHLALATPGSVEVDHQVLGGLDQLAEVLLVLHLNDVLAHQLLLLGRLRSTGAEELSATVLGVDSLVTGLPVGRAHFAVLSDELEGLDQTEGLIHTATDGEVVHGDLLNHSLRVDDEETAESNTSLGHEHSVLGGNLLRDITHNRDLHVAQTSLLAGSLDPGEMGLDRVSRAGNDLGVQLGELLSSVAEGNDLSGAEGAEVLGIEEQHDVLSYPLPNQHPQNVPL